MASSDHILDSPHILFAAPHRLAFLTGSFNFTALAIWWLLQIAAMHLIPIGLPTGILPPALIHGPAMLYLLFPPFIFGFLMTVFPRWMGYPDLVAREFGPVSSLLAIGSLIALCGLFAGAQAALASGFAVMALGWGIALVTLAKLILRNRADAKPVCLHAISAWVALLAGFAALLAAAAFFGSSAPYALFLSLRIGVTLFLLPVFLTVCHRMLPFFAGSVVPDYVRWRPDWLIGALWVLLSLRIAGQIGASPTLDAVGNAGLAGVTAMMAWKWWPRAKAPGLLNVLVWGFAWAPLGFTLSALRACGLPYGRAPDHALLIGLACSLLVAMVTRVTHGHSGRPLAMSKVAWLAFWGIQIAAVMRISAALRDEDGRLLLIAAGLFLFAPLPWLIRHMRIYTKRRKDGKPG